MTARTGQDQPPDNGMDETAVQTALEHQPEVAIPADFATRVAAQAAELDSFSRSRVPHNAKITALVMACVVAVSLFVLAPRTSASFGNFPFDLELVVLLQLGLLAWWLTRQPSGVS